MALEVVAERRLKFSEAPVMDAHDLETSGQALRRTAAQAQRARTEQHDPQAARIGVPQGLHGLGPVGDLLHLVDDEERPFTEQRGLLPLLQQPAAIAHPDIIGIGVVARVPAQRHELPDPGGLADLSRSDQDLDERGRLSKPLQQLVDERALELFDRHL